MNIYLDNNASTQIDEHVLDAMMPFLQDVYANPSSVHRSGRHARNAMESAREQVARLVKTDPSQVIFTSGGTEANNLALKGVAGLYDSNAKGSIAISAIEHASVTEPAKYLQKKGWSLDIMDVDSLGCVTDDALNNACKEDTRMISVIMANNETGVIQDISGISEKVRQKEILLHTDAVQAAGKIELDINEMGVHMLTLSSHKIYGPKGTGALVVDSSIELEPMLHGGGHESGRRAGTENLAGIVGFGAAAELAMNEFDERKSRFTKLRDYLESELKSIPGVIVFSQETDRIPNTVMLSVPGIDGETLLMNMDKEHIAVSSGSACSSHDRKPNHVLNAMGVDQDVARSAIRVSFGKNNSRGDVDVFMKCLRQQLENMNMLAIKNSA